MLKLKRKERIDVKFLKFCFAKKFREMKQKRGGINENILERILLIPAVQFSI